MRALIATTNLSGPGGSAAGAAGNTWRAVAEELGRRIEGIVIAPRAHGTPERERIGGLEVKRVGPMRPVSSLEDALRGTEAWRVAAVAAAMRLAVRRALRAGTFDVVHAFWAFPAGWACMRSEVPVMLSCPGSDLHSWSGRGPAGRLVRSVVRRADIVAPVSTEGVRLAMLAGARRAEPVPVCFDPEVFRLSRNVPSEPVIAYAGRLTRAKGLFVLADAMRRLRTRIPDARLVVCGTGPDAASIAQELGEGADLRGAVPPADVARVLASARVAVLPSFAEGMPASVLEALAVGRGVVATDSGEHTALLRSGGGRVVDRGDAAGLADALEAELNGSRDPAGLRALVAEFTPEAVAEVFVELYEDVAGAARRSRQPSRA